MADTPTTPDDGATHDGTEVVELPVIDERGPDETAPHPLEVDDDEAARGLAAYRAVDDLDDDSDGTDAL